MLVLQELASKLKAFKDAETLPPKEFIFERVAWKLVRTYTSSYGAIVSWDYVRSDKVRSAFAVRKLSVLNDL